jgi:hypothetical protein
MQHTILQGEIVVMRMPDDRLDIEATKHGVFTDGILWFADGSQKTLAGFTVWIALLHCWKDMPHLITDPQVVQLISSLLLISTTFKAGDADGNTIDNAISRIIKQNTDAKVQPISSFMWASILKGMNDHASSTTTTYEEMMDRYNSHPEVVSHCNSEADAATGAGSILLDPKKRTAVRHWVDKTCSSAWNIVESSSHDIPYAMGPFGETIASYTFLFLGSVANGMAADSTCPLQPLEHETYISVDYNLPLTSEGQSVLFSRITSDFAKQTACVPVAQKRKYRASQPDLLNLRHMMCIWAQFKPHMLTRVGSADVLAWEDALRTSSARDDDFVAILQTRPKILSLSMFPSQRDLAQQKAQDRDDLICLDVERERVDVRTAKWKFFKSALNRDHLRLSQVKDVPIKVQAATHRKEVVMRQQQADNGEKAVMGYLNKFMQITHLPKIELIKQEISNFTAKVALCLSGTRTGV